MLTALMTVVACSTEKPNGAGPSQSPPLTGSCSTPAEGCPCTATGATAACVSKTSGEYGQVLCAHGSLTCVGGLWGSCHTDATSRAIRTRTAPLTVISGQLQTLGTGAPQACVNYADAGDGSVSTSTSDAAINLDECNPYCNLTSDTSDGFDAGAAFVERDGGGIVAKVCGDGSLNGIEECDDGNQLSGDGCSKTCTVELGFECLIPGLICTPALNCGNGTKTGSEECDDGNLLPYDGCSPTCQRDLVCPVGGCTPLCGDGFLFPLVEACDDGNLRDGDGCDHNCVVEPDTVCSPITAPAPDEIVLPIILRDFKGYPQTGGHPDFENWCCGDDKNIVNTTLAADGRPTLQTGHTGSISSAASFHQWYHSDPTVNKTVVDKITLARQPDGSYLYTSNNFYPLDGNPNGFGNYPGWSHDYHFTSELRYPFTFKGTGSESFTFTGDDDVFVFVNNKLLVDLGGVHGAETATVTLDATLALSLGLTVGTTYEIVVFQAERHTSGSNYALTLRGFDKTISECVGPKQTTIVRDFPSNCPLGTRVSWDSFLWRAKVAGGTTLPDGGDGGASSSNIEFRAATADTIAALPPTPLAAPVSVPIGTATHANSPDGVAWTQELDGGGAPIPVSTHLINEGATRSKDFLRVYMTFNVDGTNSPVLFEWQQQFSCVPAE